MEQQVVFETSVCIYHTALYYSLGDSFIQKLDMLMKMFLRPWPTLV